MRNLITAIVKKLFPRLYEEMLQESHEDWLQENGANEKSLAFQILKDQKTFDDVVDGMMKSNSRDKGD